MAFREVDDNLWVKIKLFLPPGKPKTGRPRTKLRKAFNGILSILYVLTTGCAWSDVPRRCGEPNQQFTGYTWNSAGIEHTNKFSKWFSQKGTS